MFSDPHMTTNALPSRAIIVALAALLWGFRCIALVVPLNPSRQRVTLVGGLTGVPLGLLVIL